MQVQTQVAGESRATAGGSGARGSTICCVVIARCGCVVLVLVLPPSSTQPCFALQGATAPGWRRCEGGKQEAHRVSSTGTPKAQVKISEGEKPVVCGNTTTVNERMAAVEY